MPLKLQFGLNGAAPRGIRALWGARWIFPSDMVMDKVSLVGQSPDRERLEAWVKMRLMRARAAAQSLAAQGQLSPRGQETIVLVEDDTGVLVGNPNRSHGYLYTAAWLKESK